MQFLLMEGDERFIGSEYNTHRAWDKHRRILFVTHSFINVVRKMSSYEQLGSGERQERIINDYENFNILSWQK